MGYIFDAINRAGDDGRRPDAQEPASGATPINEGLRLTEPPAPSEAPPPAADWTPPSNTKDSTGMAEENADLSGLDERLVALLEPASLMAEEYRAIRTGLLARTHQRRHTVYTITSATPQEGKTITSLNLGLAFAELRNRSTIVVEADLRLPQFAKLLNLRSTPGFVGVLEGACRVQDTILRVPGTTLNVLPAGRGVSNLAVQLLSGTHCPNAVKWLKQHFDQVIIDTPPVVELADAGILGALSDQVMLVARMNRTPRQLVDQAIRTLTSYNAPVAGLIATDQQVTRRRHYYRYGYRYAYRHAYRYAKAA